MAAEALPVSLLATIVDQVVLPILVLDGRRFLYSNAAASDLRARLKCEHGIHLDVIVRDHIDEIGGQLSHGRVVTLLTARNGEPFYVHAHQIAADEGAAPCVFVTIREHAPDRTAFTRRYHLSRREAEVVGLVLRGYGNRDIAQSLGITPATAKKHLTSVFNKVGVDSRSQLLCRLA